MFFYTEKFICILLQREKWKIVIFALLKILIILNNA